MRWNKAFIPTLKEDPKEAENASHRLLLRGGFVKQHQSGVYIFLPLGWKVMLKIMKIVREEMDRIGAQEMLMPALTSGDVWKKSGRWEDFGSDMFRLKDRKNRDIALAPTHEEIMTLLAKEHIRSYRDLPQIWYQIQTKFRDEPRSRAGILRVREFLMKDSYSFDADWEGLTQNYEKHREAYARIFMRSGLEFIGVEASTGLMGGSKSEEFMVIADAGEDSLIICEKCGYSANLEVAEGMPRIEKIEGKFEKKEKVHTPSVRSVEEVSDFLGISPSLIVKSLMYHIEDEPVLVLIRGDYEINEAKLAKVLGPKAHLASHEYIEERFGVEPGFLGPIGIDVKRIIADETIRTIKNFVVGANKSDYHIVGVNMEDLNIEAFYDLRAVKEGDYCPKCGHPLVEKKAIEIGHIFQLGTKYSESLEAYYTDKNGKLRPIVMGSYGIGIGRIMAAAVELYHDEKGIIWPVAISPYEVSIVEINPQKTGDKTEEIYNELKNNGIDVIWDDRNETAGFKFKDSELVGYPFKVVVGERKLKDNRVEVQIRKSGESFDVDRGNLVAKLKELIEEEKNSWKKKNI